MRSECGGADEGCETWAAGDRRGCSSPVMGLAWPGLVCVATTMSCRFHVRHESRCCCRPGFFSWEGSGRGPHTSAAFSLVVARTTGLVRAIAVWAESGYPRDGDGGGSGCHQPVERPTCTPLVGEFTDWVLAMGESERFTPMLLVLQGTKRSRPFKGSLQS